MASLFQAIEDDNLEHIKALVEVHHVDIEEIYPDKPRMKITPLFDAARKNRYKIAEYLLSVGAKIDQENSEGMTPIAAYRRYKELTTLFIEQGADVSGKITNGTYRPTCKPNKSGRQLRPPQRMQTRTVERGPSIQRQIYGGMERFARCLILLVHGMAPMYRMSRVWCESNLG